MRFVDIVLFLLHSSCALMSSDHLVKNMHIYKEICKQRLREIVLNIEFECVIVLLKGFDYLATKSGARPLTYTQSPRIQADTRA